jgi:hypothetical protein
MHCASKQYNTGIYKKYRIEDFQKRQRNYSLPSTVNESVTPVYLAQLPYV